MKEKGKEKKETRATEAIAKVRVKNDFVERLS